MGAWDTGVYDNDGAADWAYELADRGLPALVDALRLPPPDAYLESPDGAAALAAADVVARLCSGGGEQSPYAESVIQWVQEHRNVEWQPFVTPAVAALDRVTSPANNELYELWAETDSLHEWLAVVAEVRSRLPHT